MRTPLVVAVLIGALVAAASQGTPASTLTIEKPTFSQYEDGESVPADFRFVPGETIFFSFQIGGYRSVEDDKEQREVGLLYTIDVTDPFGTPMIDKHSGRVETELVAEDKKWMPKVRHTIPIPTFAPGGTYKIAIYVKDKVANNEVAREVVFQVRGPNVTAATALTIGDFGFYRGEDDKQPLATPAYRGGDPVWMRFHITGYKLAEKNRFDVGYGVAVLRASGEQLFAQPDAANEQDESFYPRRYLPGAFSISLNKDIKPGQYVVVLTAHDKVGNQNAEIRESFTVE